MESSRRRIFTSESIRDRNTAAIQLAARCCSGIGVRYGPSHSKFSPRSCQNEWRRPSSYLDQMFLRRSPNEFNFKKDGRGNPLPAMGFAERAEWHRLGELVLAMQLSGKAKFSELAR